jgi:hypothetical protein
MIPYVSVKGTVLALKPDSVRIQVEDGEIEIPRRMIIDWWSQEGSTTLVVTKVYDFDVQLSWAREAGLVK